MYLFIVRVVLLEYEPAATYTTSPSDTPLPIMEIFEGSSQLAPVPEAFAFTNQLAAVNEFNVIADKINTANIDFESNIFFMFFDLKYL